MMARLMGIVIFLIVGPTWAAWQCDQGKELSSVKSDQMIGRDSRPFKYAMQARYEQHADPMRAFEAANPNAAPNAYLETEAGKKTLFKYRDIKAGFDYDAVTEYLLAEPLGDHPSNPDRVDYTHIYKKGKKVSYLDGDRLVATRIQISPTESILKIFNTDCSLREIVSFPALETGKDHYQYKINAAYCNQHSHQSPKSMDADKQDEMKIYLPDDESELASLKSRLNRDCKQWPAQRSSKASAPATTK